MRCKYLDNQVCIRSNGQYRLCCASLESDNLENVRTHTIEEWRNSPTHVITRQQLENNIWPDACLKCKLDEDAGRSSQRLKTAEYGPGLTHLDLRFSNSCNLSCSMCWPGSSSKLVEEHKALGELSPWGSLTFDLVNWYEEDLVGNLIKSVPELKEVYLTGGEPFMVKGILDFLKKLDENVTVRFNTNGTLYNDKIFKELKRFKHVNISFSVDGIGKVNDYIRWGSTWKEIEYNINKYQELSGFFSVSSVVQILNILYIDELKEWVKSLNLEHYETFLLNPKHYCLYNAVDDIKNTVKGYDHIRNIEADVSEQNKFVEYTNILDNNRNCKIRDYLPEVAKLYGIN
jgi:MoaA/NifB/PqqE/SkfB family radical SAM enzyme